MPSVEHAPLAHSRGWLIPRWPSLLLVIIAPGRQGGGNWLRYAGSGERVARRVSWLCMTS